MHIYLYYNMYLIYYVLLRESEWEDENERESGMKIENPNCVCGRKFESKNT